MTNKFSSLILRLPLLILFLISTIAIAQKEIAALQKKADKFFENENYVAAIPIYEEILQQNSGDANNNFRLGICWLRSNIDKTKSIDCFNKVIESGSDDEEINLLLGHAYAFDYQFDKAIEQFTIYMQASVLQKDKRMAVLRRIYYCENAREMIKFPVNAEFQNMGGHVNSAFPDYFPFVSHNEDMLIFNSRRPGATDPLPNGLYSSRIFLSSEKDGEFGEAVPVILKEEIEGNIDIIGLSGDGKKALIYFDNDTISGDIYLAKLHNGILDSIELLGENVNTEFVEAAASISLDGKSIFFSSNRFGGFGGFDLYVIRQLPDGQWSQAENLGAEINTDVDEDFPNLSPDESRLYFSSRGHLSMGGYDIFFSELTANGSWSPPRNVGYPINTVGDDMNFRLASGGKYGYISGLRIGGRGDIDIYRVDFRDVEGLFSALTGIITSADTAINIAELSITAWQMDNMDVPYGIYKPNSRSGRYVMILAPGSYLIEVTSDSGVIYEEEIEVSGMSSFKSEIFRDFQVGKQMELTE